MKAYSRSLLVLLIVTAGSVSLAGQSCNPPQIPAHPVFPSRVCEAENTTIIELANTYLEQEICLPHCENSVPAPAVEYQGLMLRSRKIFALTQKYKLDRNNAIPLLEAIHEYCEANTTMGNTAMEQFVMSGCPVSPPDGPVKF